MLPDGRIISWPARAERISQRLLLRNRVKELHSSTLAMRADVFAKAGLYDEQTPNGYAEDYDFILRVARVGRIGAVTAPLADIRKDSGSWWPGNAAVTVNGLEYLLAKHPEIAGSARGHARLLGQIAFSRSLLGQRGRALQYAASAIARWPASPTVTWRWPTLRPAWTASTCCALRGWLEEAWPSSRSGGKKRGDFHDVRAQGRTRTGPQGRPTCVPAGGHGDGAAAAAA